jgi:glycosyltransferase involved in cell wall biosynthesis
LFIVIGPEDKRWLERSREGMAPRLDYRLVAESCHGEIREFYPSPAMLNGHKPLRTCRSLAANLRFALQIIRSTPPGGVIYSTGETWGLPIALASHLGGRRHTHVVYAHNIYSRAWLCLIRWLRPIMHIDGWVCITQYQAGLLRRALGPEASPIAVVAPGVDTAFYDPGRVRSPDGAPYILSVGAEMRNYPLLLEAARDLDIHVIIKASSSWMATARLQMPSIPPNTELVTRRLTHLDLRELYAGAAFVVVPLYDTPQASGITAIFEAFAMGKCVLASKSRGLPDALVDGSTGYVVDPDVDKLARVTDLLLSQTGQRVSLGERAYHLAREALSLEAHAKGIVSFIEEIAARTSLSSERLDREADGVGVLGQRAHLRVPGRVSRLGADDGAW